MRASRHSATLLILRSQTAFAGAAVLVKFLCLKHDPLALAVVILLLAPLLALLYCGAQGELGSLRRLNWGVAAVRGAFVALSLAGSYVALARLPLAIAIALSFLTPLFVTLIALCLPDSAAIRWRRRAAIVLGLLGVLCIARPWEDTLPIDKLGELAAVGGALAYALNITVLRRTLARQTRPECVSANLLGTSICSGLFALPLFGPHVLGLHLGVDHGAALASALLLLATATALGVLCQAEAHARAESSYLAPFTYLQLVWASIAAALLWHEWGDGPTWLGIALIIAGGFYTARREQLVRQHRPLAAAPAAP